VARCRPPPPARTPAAPFLDRAVEPAEDTPALAYA